MIGSSFVLRALRIPPEPQPPAGAPGSLRVFRAAPAFYRLRLIQWGFRQLSALGGVIMAVIGLQGMRTHAGTQIPFEGFAPLLLMLEGLGILVFFIQIPFTLAATRLDYELRWYLVTDRSLRIRSGIWTVEELTMTFANIQEMTVSQGPIHRLLGIANLRVRSAGGGSPGPKGGMAAESHVASFHGVDNAEEIRDLILAHLRRLKDTGLGDPDAHPAEPDRSESAAGEGGETLEAARELLAEARALRELVEPGSRPAGAGSREATSSSSEPAGTI